MLLSIITLSKKSLEKEIERSCTPLNVLDHSVLSKKSLEKEIERIS